VLFGHQSVFGQAIERRFKNYSIEDGLSQSTIFDIKQDQQGYTWIATADGLNVFNGVEFEVYKKTPGSKTSLSSNFVYAVLPLKNGLIWAVTQDRIINQINPSLKTVKPIALLDDIQENMFAIKQMLIGFEGEIWLSTYENGILVLDESARVIRKINTGNNQLKSNVINQVVKVEDKIFVSTTKGISVFNKSNKNAQHLLIERNIGATYFHRNYLYVSDFNKSQLLKYNYTNLQLSADTLIDGHDIVGIVVTKNNVIWAGTLSEGIFEINQSKTYQYKHSPIDRWSLIDNNIFFLSKDANEDIWIGTNSGLSIYKKAYNAFRLLRKNNSSNSLSSNKIYEIYEDQQQRIWFINYDGSLDVLNKAGFFRTYSPNTGIINIRLRSIVQISEDYFILGSNNSGLFKFYPSKNLFVPIKEFQPKQIRKIKVWNDSTLLIAHLDGLAQLNLQTNTHETNMLKKSYTVYDFLVRDKQIYIATFGGGLLKYNVNQKTSKSYRETDGKLGLQSNNIMAIVPLSSGQLAIGTYGGGLSIFNLEEERFTSLTESEGLRNNSVYGIIEDKKNNLWLSTNIGISRVSSDLKNIKNFDLPIQLQSLEFNEDAFLKASNDQLYFGGVNGVNYFKPDNIEVNINSPMAIINGVIVENERIEYNKNQNIALNYKENDVSFLVTARRISTPEKTTYLYILEGLDNEWRTSPFTNKIDYNNIPPGNYTFKIKSCNEDGYCDETFQEVRFTIKSPIYKTWWFLILLLLLVSASILTFFRYRTNNLRAEYIAKMTNAELRALRIQMNPHFIFNSLNSIQYYVLNSDSKTAYKYLTKFSALMRKTLQHSKENFLPLKDELKALELYLELENLRLENTLNSSIHVSEAIDADKTLIPTLFLQPFVENAIIHGLLPKKGERKISIIIEPLDKGFQCRILDNGIGRKAANELNKNRNRSHKSTALEAIESRIKIINTSGKTKITMTIEDLVKDNKPLGTEVILTIK
jgi:ligand-binding sensor domain-containing protein